MSRTCRRHDEEMYRSLTGTWTCPRCEMLNHHQPVRSV